MTAEVAHAHALHLKNLIQLAKEHLAKGEAIPQELWSMIDDTTDEMIAAMPVELRL